MQQHKTLFKQFPVARTLGLILSVALAVVGQTPKTDELPPTQTLERQMTGAETHRYKVSLEKDEFFQVRVEQKGVDVALKLLNADGKELATMDSPNDKQGPETLSFVAATAEVYLLEVSGFDAKAGKGNYTIRREASRTATTADRKRVGVERLFAEGITAQAIQGQSETALAKLAEALQGWYELKDNYLADLTGEQIKQLKDAPKRAQAQAIDNEASALSQQGSKESLQASILKYAEARRLYSDLDDKQNEAHALYELGNIYGLLGERQKAIEYFTLTLPLRKAVGDKAGEASTLNNIGVAYDTLGENQKALDYYNQALKLIRAASDRSPEAKMLNNIGGVYAETRENQKALEYYNQSLLISRGIRDTSGEATTLNNIGKVHSDLGENQKALDCFNQSLQLSRALGDSRKEALVLSNIGLVYSTLGENRKSLDYYNQALLLRKAVGDKDGEATTLNSIGGVYNNLGENPNALDHYNQALTLIRAASDRSREARTLTNIGKVYADTGENQKALDYYNQSLLISREVRDTSTEATTLNNIGKVYADTGENQKALDHYNQALTLIRADSDRSREAKMLNYIGKVYADTGENQKALNYYNQALLISREVRDTSTEAPTLNNIGKVYADTGENQKALDYYNQSLLISKEVRDTSTEATTLNNIGQVYSDLGENQKALDCFNQSLQLTRALGDSRKEAFVLSNIGLVYSTLGENRKALDYYNQSLQLRKAVADKDGEAATLNNIGLVHNNLGEKQKALDYYTESLSLFRAVGDKRGGGITLNGIGNVYEDLGEHQKALEYFNQSLALTRTVGNRNGEADTLIAIGSLYGHLGEKQKALAYFALALPLFKTVGDRSGEAATLNNIGGVYSDLGEKQKALDYYTQSLTLNQAVGNRMGQAGTLSNIGLVYSELGEYQKALEYYNKSLPLQMAVGDRGGQTATLNNIGLVYSKLGEYQKAREYYNQALPFSRAVGDRDGEANILTSIGLAYSKLGEYQKAREYFNQSLPLRKAVGNRRGEGITLNNLMYVWSWLNNPRLAILYGKQSVNNYQSLRAEIRGLDRELQQSFLGTVEGTYRLLAELLVQENRIPEAERVLRMLKEEEYFEFARNDGQVVASLDERINLNPAEKQAVGQYETAALEITRIYHEIEQLEKEKPTSAAGQNSISDRQAELNKKLEVSTAKLESFLVELSKDFAKRDTDSRNVEESSQAIVREWNDPQTAVISTIVGSDNVSLILTTVGFQRGYVVPVSEKKLNKLVGNFRTAIIERSDPRAAGQELYNALVKPLEKDLESIKARTLIWSLDKFLRYVPMSALWDKERGYLAQTYASVVLALASRQNLAFRPAGKAQWQALGVGVSKKAEGFAPLSYVPKELQAIVRDSTAQPKKQELGIIAGRRLLDEQFTYESLLKSLRNYRFTHAATHFKFIPGTKAEGLNSFLLMGNGEKLTLAQVQDSKDIFAGIELLTLSACDTGYGGKTADGREIEGFGVLAQRKGARAIMATLWPVDDESTRDLMIEFYGGYQKPNFTKAEALRQAQLALLQEPDKRTVGKTSKAVSAAPKRFAHPYYWSPFILIGNWW